MTEQAVSVCDVHHAEYFVSDEAIVEIGETDLTFGAAVVDVHAGEAVAVAGDAADADSPTDSAAVVSVHASGNVSVTSAGALRWLTG